MKLAGHVARVREKLNLHIQCFGWKTWRRGDW